MDHPEAVKETINEAIGDYIKETRGYPNTKEDGENTKKEEEL